MQAFDEKVINKEFQQRFYQRVLDGEFFNPVDSFQHKQLDKPLGF